MFVGSVDFEDEKAIRNTLTAFEENARIKNIETACVITQKGRIYECFGVSYGVYPDEDLGNELYGAYVSHNHPINETEYTFSKQDLDLFMKYNLSVLRGCDEKYVYEFNRNSEDIEDIPELLIGNVNEENFRHIAIIKLAIMNKIGYRRWKK